VIVRPNTLTCCLNGNLSEVELALDFIQVRTRNARNFSQGCAWEIRLLDLHTQQKLASGRGFRHRIRHSSATLDNLHLPNPQSALN
jgi:hypothetical protein